MASGAGLLALGRYGAAALGWAGSVVLIRSLSPLQWGEYSLVFSIIGLIGTLADLQLGRLIVRDLSEPGAEDEVLGSYVGLRALLGVACYVAAMLTVVLGGYPDAVVALMAVAGVQLLIAAVSAALAVYFAAQLWMRAIAVGMLLAQTAQLILTAAVAVVDRDLILFALPAVAFELASLGWQVRTMRRRPPLRMGVTRWRAWFNEAVWLSIGSALGVLYAELDSVLLSKLADLRAVGVYAVGVKFATFTNVVAVAVSASLLVTLTRTWKDDRQEFVHQFRRAFTLYAVAGGAVGIEFALFSSQVTTLLYGRHYASGHLATTELVLSEVIAYFSQLCFVALVAIGRNLPYAVATAFGVVVNVAVNFVLIPRYSYDGAAAATLATEGLVLLILAGNLIRRGARWSWVPIASLLKVVGAGLVMTVIALLLRGAVLWEVAAAVAGTTYLAVLHLTRVAGRGGLRALMR